MSLDITDRRIVNLTQVQSWFLHWETHASSKGSIMSVQCHEDLQSTIIGFIELCNYVINVHQGWSVTPAMINSDAIENIFVNRGVNSMV